MSFASTSRFIRLDGTNLTAHCQAIDGKFKSSSISLNKYIGVLDGGLRWGFTNFQRSSRNIHLDGSVLSAEVEGRNGKWAVNKLDLNAHIQNNDGALESLPLPYTEKVFSTAMPNVGILWPIYMCIDPELDGSILRAKCVLTDGLTIRRSSIDLDQHIGLYGGFLVVGGKGFSKNKKILRNLSLADDCLRIEAETLLGETWTQIVLDIRDMFWIYDGFIMSGKDVAEHYA